MILYAFIFPNGIIYVCNNETNLAGLQNEYFLCGGEDKILIPAIEKVTKLHWDGETRYIDKVLNAKSERLAWVRITKLERELYDMKLELFFDIEDNPKKKDLFFT